MKEAEEAIMGGSAYGQINDAENHIKQIRLHCPKLEKTLNKYDMVAFALEELKSNMIERKES